MQLPPLNFTVLDTETTGFIPKVNRVIEYAGMRAEQGKIVDEYETLVGIDEGIPKEVQTITRIYDADLEGKPSFTELQSAIEQNIGEDTIIIGQNIGFDIRMLKGEGIDLSTRKQLDTSMLASLVFPELESYSLPYMSQVLKLDHTPVHRALGDVRATLELLSKCWERLLQLNIEQYDQLMRIAERSDSVYQELFALVPKPTTAERPSWWQAPGSEAREFSTNSSVSLPSTESLTLVEQPLDPAFINTVVQQALETKQPHCIAVKNAHISHKQLNDVDGVQLIEPPSHMLHSAQAEALLAKESFTQDETLLAIKLLWYQPVTKDQLPLHGNEKDLWYSTLACTDASEEYLEQFTSKAPVKLLNHWQLLRSIDPTRGDSTLFEALSDHVLVFDNATALEDTASNAFGYTADCHHIRAASADHPTLTNFIDALQIWIEKTRNNQDLFYLAPSELGSTDVAGLREQLATCLQNDHITSVIPLKRMLEDLAFILNPEGKNDYITYIELGRDDRQILNSVPLSIASTMQRLVYDRFTTRLLVPPNSADVLDPLLTNTTEHTTVPVTSSTSLELIVGDSVNGDTLLSDPPDGKTIILAAGRKRIEHIFTEYTEQLEEQGINLFCQGFSGGTSRIQAEFLASSSPAILVVSGFLYETLDLPPNTASTLMVESLPFDHPNHAIVSKRSERYQNGFMEYNLPRMEFRLYRILRAFASMSTKQGEVYLSDARLTTKKYGEHVVQFIEPLFHNAKPTDQPNQSDGNPHNKTAPEGWQLEMF